jgi:hypothetical protein
VEIVVGPVRGGFAGRAHVDRWVGRRTYDREGRVLVDTLSDAGGLTRIELAAPRPRLVAHEVAHAWVHGGPSALVEGATNLLADCVARSAPRQFGWDVGGNTLEGLEDLRSWRNADDAAASTRSAGYAASHGLMRAAARLVPERTLWRADWTWGAFADVLREAGDTVVLPVVEGGVASQLAALADADGDGLSALEEQLLGTDPDDWDSDRDGWWDGAPVELGASGAVPIPSGGGPVCTGLAGGPLGATVRLTGLHNASVWSTGRKRSVTHPSSCGRVGRSRSRMAPLGTRWSGCVAWAW